MSSTSEPKSLDPRLVDKVTDDLVEAIKEKASSGKITCPMLRKLAEDQGVPYNVAGTAADVAGVKVHDCSLGCF